MWRTRVAAIKGFRESALSKSNYFKPVNFVLRPPDFSIFPVWPLQPLITRVYTETRCVAVAAPLGNYRVLYAVLCAY